jgi:hypothetical protein
MVGLLVGLSTFALLENLRISHMPHIIGEPRVSLTLNPPMADEGQKTTQQRQCASHVAN